MRIAKVIGTVTLSKKLPDLKPGRYLIVEALDNEALHASRGSASADVFATRRGKPMPESLVVFDDLGAGVGQMIAVSEGREACMPFYPTHVPIDAYNAAMLDQIEVTNNRKAEKQNNTA